MKIEGDHFGEIDTNRFGQVTIQFFAQLDDLDGERDVHMNDLCVSVDPPVGAPGRMHGSLHTKDLFNRSLERPLHRALAGVSLPTKEGSPIVMKGQSVGV
jgi:hypothetical protein